MAHIHVTRDGEKIRLCDLTDQHLVSIIRYHRRRAAKGVEVRVGARLLTSDDIYADVDIVYGKRALDALDHDYYLEELRRRGLRLPEPADTVDPTK
jgi:hypothetical protein